MKIETYPDYIERESMITRKIAGTKDSLGTLMKLKGFSPCLWSVGNKNPRRVGVWDNKVSLIRMFLKSSDLTTNERKCKTLMEFDFGTHNYDKVLSEFIMNNGCGKKNALVGYYNGMEHYENCDGYALCLECKSLFKQLTVASNDIDALAVEGEK